MLRQIKWRVRDGPITKNGVLPVTTLVFQLTGFYMTGALAFNGLVSIKEMK